jgi:hypothetical protein
MFNLPNREPEYLKEGLDQDRINNDIFTYTKMQDEILDDFLDGRITKNTMEDMMKWCADMLIKARGEKYG